MDLGVSFGVSTFGSQPDFNPPFRRTRSGIDGYPMEVQDGPPLRSSCWKANLFL